MKDTIYIATQTINDIQNASGGFSWKDGINILFAIINIAVLCVTAWYVRQVPIEAVKVAEKLQTDRLNDDRKYQNKLNIFISVYGDRHLKGFSYSFNLAVNQIPIVFYDNQRVRSLNDAFIREHQRQPFDYDACHLCLLDLVQAMALDLGYSDLNNSSINGFFLPKTVEESNLAHDIQTYYYLKEHRNNYFDDLSKGNQNYASGKNEEKENS